MGHGMSGFVPFVTRFATQTLAIGLNVLLEAGTIYFWRRIPWRYRLLCLLVGVGGIYIGMSDILRQVAAQR